MTRKIFTRAAANLFSLIDFPEILSSLPQFLLLICFLKLKIYILIHIRLRGRVSDKNIFSRLTSGNKTFFGLNCINMVKMDNTVFWTIDNFLRSQGVASNFKQRFLSMNCQYYIPKGNHMFQKAIICSKLKQKHWTNAPNVVLDMCKLQNKFSRTMPTGPCRQQ